MCPPPAKYRVSPEIGRVPQTDVGWRPDKYRCRTTCLAIAQILDVQKPSDFQQQYTRWMHSRGWMSSYNQISGHARNRACPANRTSDDVLTSTDVERPVEMTDRMSDNVQSAISATTRKAWTSEVLPVDHRRIGSAITHQRPTALEVNRNYERRRDSRCKQCHPRLYLWLWLNRGDLLWTVGNERGCKHLRWIFKFQEHDSLHHHYINLLISSLS